MITVRLACIQDIPQMVKMAKGVGELQGWKYDRCPDESAAMACAEHIVTNHLALVACNGVEVVGMLLAYYAPLPLSMHLNWLSGVFLWVEPEHRGQGAGSKLLEAMVDIGRLSGVHVISLALANGCEVSDNSMVRFGFRPDGRNFTMEI